MLLTIFGSHIATALLLLFITAPSWLLIAALDYSASWYLSITWQDLLDQHYIIWIRFVPLWYVDVLLQLVHLNQWPELLQSPPLTQFVAITHFIFLSHCYCIVTVIIIITSPKTTLREPLRSLPHWHHWQHIVVVGSIRMMYLPVACFTAIWWCRTCPTLLLHWS